MRRCQIQNCNRKHYAKGLCSAHYQRVWKGTPLKPEQPILSNTAHGNGHCSWKGGNVLDGDGRMMIYAPDHPYPSYRGKYVYRYRLVMERHIGRYLAPTEVVHHRNGDWSDDRLENLQLFSSQAEHMRAHTVNGKWQKARTA